MLADLPALGIAVIAFGEARIEPKLQAESPTRPKEGNAQTEKMMCLIFRALYFVR